MLCAVKDSGKTKRFVYAASSSTYGDSKELPKVEDRIGRPLSPYAVTKLVNEIYADVFAKTYGVRSIGLRYFNVFGPRQNPDGAYAAVIPLFIKAVKNGEAACINGDGDQTRDFTFIENIVQANIKAFFIEENSAINQVYNVACGENITLNSLWEIITQMENTNITPFYGLSRLGDVKDSLADISKAKMSLNYDPEYTLEKGLRITINEWRV
jgi:UDP-N-acetylglucosamine 4-epimerase